jgi:hypothetical protein
MFKQGRDYNNVGDEGRSNPCLQSLHYQLATDYDSTMEDKALSAAMLNDEDDDKYDDQYD